MPTTYEPIATTTLGSAQATITFSSIPSTYTDLRLVLVGTGSGNITVRLNSDTATNYSLTILYGNGASALSARTTSATRFNMAYYGASNTTPTLNQIDFFSYAGSTNKTVLNNYSVDLNGSGGVERSVGLWRNTAAISTILIDSLASFNTGTTATLYGILKA